MRSTETLREARREFVVCNACRYCEGFCAVFPAMELRREFSDGDLGYLANLCHNCRGCFYACQYAPPHEFAINLPRALARLRAETYEAYAWPKALARLFHRNGLVASAVTAIALALVLLLTMALHRPESLFAVRTEPGAFYAVIPAWAMIAVAGATFAFSLLALAVGAVRFWRASGGEGAWRPRVLLAALGDVLTLRNLGGGGGGCNDVDDRFSQSRRRFHHATFYGFLLCFASTGTAAIYEHVLGELSPYPLLSPPVLLGALGGIGLVVGTAGLAWLKWAADPEPAAREQAGAEAALLALLLMTAATGLLLLALRGTPAMGVLLAVHLGFVLALFLLMPYSRFVHGLYRAAALLRHARERRSS